VAAAALTFATCLGAARAADVKVLTAGAFKQVAVALTPAFEQQTGDHLIIDNDTAGALQKRIASGETFDVTILPPGVVDALTADGRLAPGSKQVLARTGVGVVVKTGTPLPDISTVDALRRSLLAAKSIAYIDPAAGGSSGVFVAGLLQKLGIAGEMRGKSVLVPGGLVAEHVANGEAELGIHQISEILAVKQGVTLVGPLPEDIQNYTVYAAAIGAASTQPVAARALIALIAGADGAAAIKRAGLQTSP
jgi:molybdate transport system substrate-binding protein